jgi:predicted 3-demethylubiquinone-9 3-methyltransferase (glyoxalase superfamily)
MQKKITTFLTFDGQAEEAVGFYTSVFASSRVLSTTRYEAGGPGPEGELISATFELAGQEFMALNGGPSFTFSQGISLFVDCEDQEEVDELWAKLTAGGEPGPVAGSPTASASPGRSSRPRSGSCSPTRVGRRPAASCRRCSR